MDSSHQYQQSEQTPLNSDLSIIPPISTKRTIISQNRDGHQFPECQQKYMLHNIKDKCIHYLQASVDEERVCVVLQTAHDFHLENLRTNALKFILEQ
jgi:hypothetical protein